MDIVHMQLSAKYNRKVEKVKAKILEDNSDLCSDVRIIFYRDSDLLNKTIYHNPNQKAYCIIEKKEIHLSDTVCEMEEKRLYEVLLHELLHVSYADYSEEKIIEETDKRKPKDVRDLINKVLK